MSAPAGKATAQAHNHMVSYGLLVRTSDSEQRFDQSVLDVAIVLKRCVRKDALLNPFASGRQQAVLLCFLDVPGIGTQG